MRVFTVCLLLAISANSFASTRAFEQMFGTYTITSCMQIADNLGFDNLCQMNSMWVGPSLSEDPTLTRIKFEGKNDVLLMTYGLPDSNPDFQYIERGDQFASDFYSFFYPHEYAKGEFTLLRRSDGKYQLFFREFVRHHPADANPADDLNVEYTLIMEKVN